MNMNRALRTTQARAPGGTKLAAVKRKAEVSPTKKLEPTKKRSAFGDLTNNGNNGNGNANPFAKKESGLKLAKLESAAGEKLEGVKKAVAVIAAPDDDCSKLNNRKLSLRSNNNTKKSSLPVPIPVVPAVKENIGDDPTERREESMLYETALETPESDSVLVDNVAALNLKNDQVTLEVASKFPEGVADFDAECGNNPFQVGEYAEDIFAYYMKREDKFPVKKYMDKQKELNKNMRAILIDWMVEVQENFELNHETLYLGVKLVDMFLGKVEVSRDRLQLVGTTALYVASKYDERSPPLVDDFCYICDDAYPIRDVLLMEIKLLKTLNFDIGVPLSYRFLRRYARCMKLEMETLTFARFILELSLLDYDLIDVRDSLLASACLLLALTLKGVKDAWGPTLVHYSGYAMSDIFDLTYRVFHMLTNTPQHLKTITTKYSHKVFHEVAKISLPETLDLQY